MFGAASPKRRDLANIGWHTYRHAYRSLLSGEETPLEVQQKLNVHLLTTDDYGGPPMENRRQANRVVVRKILMRRSSQ